MAIKLAKPHIIACSILIYCLQGANTAFSEEPTKITLDQAVQLALKHNHALKAARTTILQNEAQEITANLRPNPVLSGDALNFPITQPNLYTSSNGNGSYIDLSAQFDLGIGFTWERGGKRQSRLKAARDATTVTKSQVSDNERTLKFNVASQFISVLLAQSSLDLALDDLKSFQKTVDAGEMRFKSGDISEGDFMKIRIQLLQFQSAVAAARLAKAQALVGLRELLGYESVPADFDVTGSLEYQPVKASKEDLQALALKERPDLRAAMQGITAARSQLDLAKTNGYQDFTTTLNLTRASNNYTGSNEYTAGVLFSFPLAVFNSNQGEIARTKHTITQAEELAASAKEAALGDVAAAYEGVRSNEEIINYFSKTLDDAKKSRDISEYAYKQGAASLLDFLDAVRSYHATQLAYRQALASYMLALEQLRTAISGGNLPIS